MLTSIKTLLQEKYIHLVFEFSLLFKGVFALIEVIGGTAAYFITPQRSLRVVAAVTQDELAEDPHDFVATHLMLWARHLSISAQHFTAIYLLSHGVIKLALIVGLLKMKLWVYPTAIVAFGMFIMYQLYRYTSTQSPWLLVLTLVDIVVIGLTWHEYHYLRRHRQSAVSTSG